MLTRTLPLLAGLLPFVAMFGAMAIGIAADTLPACNPVIDGCFSISATGRKPPGSFLFRALMLPQAGVVAILWVVTVHWLRALDANLRQSTATAILAAGFVGAVALVLYVTFLGTRLPIYEFMRRAGIYLGFAGTGLAQWFVSLALRRIAAARPGYRLSRHASWALAVAALLFVLALLNIACRALLAESDAAENRIEWLAALLMQGWFVVLYLAWRRTGFGLSVRVGKPGVG